MSKLKIVIVALAIVILAVLGAGYYLIKVRPRQVTSGRAEDQSKSAPAGPLQNSEKVYSDMSGFSFNYPAELAVNDITPDDPSYYSLVLLKKGAEEIKIAVFDTKSKTVEDWLKKDAQAPKGATLKGNFTLAGLTGKQYILGSKIYTLALDQGILYSIEGPAAGLLAETYNKIVATFALVNPEPARSGTAGSSGTIYEEEEIVE